MEMTGEQRIAAPRQKVWAALNDPNVLRDSIPGCDELQRQSETEFTATVTAKVGPVKAQFKGKVTLSDIVPPEGYTISGQGQGGVAGFASGAAKVSLREESGETVLAYAVTAQVGGRLAQIGSRLIDAAARKMAADFFARFSEAVTGRPAPAAVPAEAPAARVPSLPAAAAGLPTWLWVAGAVILAVLVLLFLIRG